MFDTTHHTLYHCKCYWAKFLIIYMVTHMVYGRLIFVGSNWLVCCDWHTLRGTYQHNNAM